MESIKNDIDAHIERAGIDAPTEVRYTPVWVPEEEPAALDLAAEGITTVVWATGFRPDYRWVEVGVFDGSGHPTHRAGGGGPVTHHLPRLLAHDQVDVALPHPLLLRELLVQHGQGP